MPSVKRLLAAFEAETRLDDAGARRALLRLERRGVIAGATGGLLKSLPGPAVGIQVERPARGRARTGAALAASLVLATLLAVPSYKAPPESLALRLDSPSAPAQVEPVGGVALQFRGRGRVEGTASSPRIVWEAGTLDLSVDPARGTALVVETREAVARVAGTEFHVERDRFLTRVLVDRGAVLVDCLGGEAWPLGGPGRVRLTAGQSAGCGPASAAGWLGLARHIQDTGPAAGQALPCVEAGLALRGGGVVDDELLVLKMELLADEAGHRAALEAARAYLTEGRKHRRAEVLALLQRLEGSP
jgi:ferric-dicitrate binding protein FerR (iron transport regulator)